MATASDTKSLLEAREAARRLGVSIFTVRRLAAAGTLPAVRYGLRGRLRFREHDVDALLAGERSEAA